MSFCYYLLMKCLICKRKIRLPRKKYCSSVCIKRAWYVSHHPDTRIHKRDADFWKTETGIGFKWEKFGAKLLGAKHLKFNSGGVDLNWNGLKVDVKAANIYKRKFKRGKAVNFTAQSGWWVFNRNKEKEVDWFLCIALLRNKPYKVL